jgi:hypothetical protein
VQVDREADRLYGLPLEEFTRERNETAKQLTKAGDGEGAAEIKALQKPSVPAWTVNQLARRSPDQVKELLAAGGDLRKAHRAALSGKGGGAIAEATKRERHAVAALVAAARALLEETGRRPTEQTLDKVQATLRAAALDLPAGKLLEQGRLVTELEPAGFGPLLAAVPPGQASARSRPVERRRDELKEAERGLREAQQEERKLRAVAAEAEEEAEHARRQAERAAERAEAAGTEADEAAARVAGLEREIKKLRRR